MDNEYLNLIKKENDWFWDTETKYNLVATDDLDSILSALLLMQYRPNWHIGYFYDFHEGLYKELGANKNIEKIGVDLSSPNMKCISNHVTCLKEDDYINPNDINLNYVNEFISLKNYHSKYNLNSLTLCYFILGLHPKSDEESALLLLPDSSFQAHYANPNYKDSYVQKQILEKMDLMELYDFMNKNDKNKFYQFQDALRIKSKFDVTENGIESIQDVDLDYMCDILRIDKALLKELEGLFLLESRSKSYTDMSWKSYDKSKFETFVVTSKSNVKFSKRVEE